MPANTTEACHSDSIRSRYSTDNALACTHIEGRSPLYIDLALDSHSRRCVNYPLLTSVNIFSAAELVIEAAKPITKQSCPTISKSRPRTSIERGLQDVSRSEDRR